jgi:mannose-6-phosphate isomerase-like protein (cupin superfamily)
MAKASLVFLVLLLLGCAGKNARHYRYDGNPISVATIETTLRENPLPTGENIHVTNLGVGESASHHLVQVRNAEPLHIHRHHDLTVWVYRGVGQMTVGTNLFTVKPGDSIYIPRAVPHRFVNGGRMPAVALVVFSPALAGKDFELVEE